EREQQKSEQLLRNVLPPSIATMLKDHGRTIARHHSEASIMFADIADFTLLSANLSPGEVVEMLNGVFTKFDELTEGRGLEKIKTIGDSYMVAAGVPEAQPDHAEVLAELALEMMASVSTQTFNGHRLVLRIGINSGPVVAGVIGTRKFSYDLWGDTVNTASRIEQYGISGEIQVSDATRKRIEHRFDIEDREPIEMKGKGLMQVYLLKGRKHLPTPEEDPARRRSLRRT
ncbi:MAG: adenylate/guanylate cyclase domain-containing protein, partial [Chloroflexi bacterium]|nr:adenylate/guanylate cyclase domain-containing protein [Chloroflexota bacterium]